MAATQPQHKSDAPNPDSAASYSITLCHSAMHNHLLNALSSSKQGNWITILNPIRGYTRIELNETEYTLKPGDIFLVVSEDSCKVLETAKDAAGWVIRFNRELLYSAHQSASDNQFLFSFMASSLAGQRLFLREKLVNTRIGAVFANILEEKNIPGPCSDVAIRLLLSQLCLNILRHWKSQATGNDLVGSNDLYSLSMLQKIFAYVDQEYMNKIKMETVANLVNMSYYSFSKFFISHTGKTFPGYVNEVRLTQSKILLTTTGMNITEIAMEVGYFSTSRFIQRFKESNQMTPQQFRKEFNKH